MEWLTENWLLLSALAVALLGVAKIVVKFTPSTKDDEVVDAIDKVINKKKE
jgi:hypothetical protein